MIDRPLFFSRIRPLFKTLSQSQVDGLNHLLDTWEANFASYPLDYLAYALATTYHETAKTMRPIEEFGKGKGKKYGVPVKGVVFYGRGYVQLTWDYNYEKAGKKLGIDLLKNPALALDAVIAARIMFQGMIDGWFTGKKLSQYFDFKSDPTGARRIINGTDKAALIAGYHATFRTALQSTQAVTQPVQAPAAPTVAPVAPSASTGFLAALLALFLRK